MSEEKSGAETIHNFEEIAKDIQRKEPTIQLTDEAAEEMAEGIKKDVYADQVDKQELSPKDLIESYLGDAATKLNVMYWADKFNDRFRSNYFTIKQVQKKTQFKNIKEAMGILQVMCLSGVCHVTTINGELKYKITLDKNDKVKLLEMDIERIKAEKKKIMANLEMEFDMKLAALEHEIERLKQKEEVAK